MSANYYHYSFLQKLIVFTVIEYENICIAGLNRRARYWELSIYTVDAETPRVGDNVYRLR